MHRDKRMPAYPHGSLVHRYIYLYTYLYMYIHTLYISISCVQWSWSIEGKNMEKSVFRYMSASNLLVTPNRNTWIYSYFFSLCPSLQALRSLVLDSVHWERIHRRDRRSEVLHLLSHFRPTLFFPIITYYEPARRRRDHLRSPVYR